MSGSPRSPYGPRPWLKEHDLDAMSKSHLHLRYDHQTGLGDQRFDSATRAARVSSVKLRKQSKDSLDLAWTSLGVVQDTSKVEQGARVVRVGGALERASHPRVFLGFSNYTITILALALTF